MVDEFSFEVQRDLFEHIYDSEISKRVVGDKEACMAFLHYCCIALVTNSERGHMLFVNNNSSTGKDYATRQVLNLFKKRGNVHTFNGATPQAFKYFADSSAETFSWDGRVVKIIDIKDETFAELKQHITDEEGQLVTNKNKSGQIVATLLKRNGTPLFVVTGAETKLTLENITRTAIIRFDENSKQTLEIVKRQIEQASGSKNRKDFSEYVLEGLNALERVEVVIPYTEEYREALLKQIGEKAPLRLRRDNPKILDFIKASAALHQKQRLKDDSGRIIAEIDDYNFTRRTLKKIELGAEKPITAKQKRWYEQVKTFESGLKDEKKWSIRDLTVRFPEFSKNTWFSRVHELEGSNLVEGYDEHDFDGHPIRKYKTLELATKGLELPELVVSQVIQVSEPLLKEGENENPVFSGLTSMTLTTSPTSPTSPTPPLETLKIITDLARDRGFVPLSELEQLENPQVELDIKELIKDGKIEWKDGKLYVRCEE